MKVLISLLFVFIPLFIFADEKKTPQELFDEVKNEWILDENGNVSFTKIVQLDSVKKEDIYIKALAYFTYNYKSGDDVIQLSDKEKGVIIGKGIFPEIYIDNGKIFKKVTSKYDAIHLLRIDVKDGKARIIITIQQFKISTHATNWVASVSTPSYPMNVNQRFPFVNEIDKQKTMMCNVIYKTVQRVKASFASIEKSLKEGNTTSDENDDW